MTHYTLARSLPVFILFGAFLNTTTAQAAPPVRPDFEAGVLLGTTLDLEQWDLQEEADGPDSPSLFSPQVGLRATWWIIDYVGLSAEVGYLPHTSEQSDGINHAMSWRAGGLIAPFPTWTYEPFLTGGFGVYHNIAGSRGKDVDMRSDWGAGLRFVPGKAERVLVQIDARHVITDGPEEFGLSHNLEVLAALQFTLGGEAEPEPVVASDRDADGIIDSNDACPDTPGLAAFGGCPDTDSDGFPDAQDACPEQAGVAAFDGCPDTDGDGIPDSRDACPNEPEDMDGFKDEDGCPEADNDGDGILDADDACPLEPELTNGFEDEDGCPEADNDGDGLVNGLDKCPDEAETYNGKEDEDGCPDGEETVVLEGSEVRILTSIYFEFGKAVIKEQSYELLDTVATVLRQNPRITSLRIEGHTDDVGTDENNLELSRERANAVREYLKSKDIEEGRIQSQGFGETQPRCEEMPELLKKERANKKAIKACRAKNRRVQFKILEVNGRPVPPTNEVPESVTPAP